MDERQPQRESFLTMHSFPRFKKDRWEEFEDIVTPEQPYVLGWRVAQPGQLTQCSSSGQPDQVAQPNQLSQCNRAGQSDQCVQVSQLGQPGQSMHLGQPGQQGQPVQALQAGQPRQPIQTGQSGQLEPTVSLADAFQEEHSGAEGFGLRKELFPGEDNPPVAGETVLWAYPNDIGPLAVGHVLLDIVPSSCCLSRNVVLHTEETVESGGSARFMVTVGEDTGQPLPSPPKCWQARDVLAAMEAFIEAEGLWDSTGCFHRAGVYDMAQGKLIKRAEDIGRHNCVDRLAGWSVLQEVPLSDKVLLISARMTSSLCAKAIRAGFPVIVSRSAVTTAAIVMAKEANVTLLGFARTQEQRFTVFNQGRCAICHEEK